MKIQPVHALVGAAIVALAGVTGLAAAEIKNTHVLDVRLPDGVQAHIRYVGDTPPEVSFAPVTPPRLIFSPIADPFGSESSFATLRRISEAMDRQAEAMLHGANTGALPLPAGWDATPVDVEKLPPGLQGFSRVSTVSGAGVCTRTLQYKSIGDGKPPQVETRVSGACPSGSQQPAVSAGPGASANPSRANQAGRAPI